MLERLKQQVSPYLQARRWLVAYSGGLDSQVLLHALHVLCRENPEFPPLSAIHVNHQIQSLANDWEEHCRQQAMSLGVEYLSFRVDIDASRNIEEHARTARYQIFTDILQEGDCMFFAHHLQDQVETFFYRLFRGAGVKGLLAMTQARNLGNGLLVRPMLTFERADLELYASLHQLCYVEDPSNRDIGFDRNFIRHQVLPSVQTRWPAINTVIQRTITHFDEVNDLLDELAADDLNLMDPQGGPEPSIHLQPLLMYSPARQRNTLRYWLLKHGISLSSQQTVELFGSVVAAKEDAMPLLKAGNAVLRRYKARLYITANIVPGSTEMNWNGLQVCVVPGYGKLSLSMPVDVDLQVRFRKGGEEIKPVHDVHTRKLKTLLQEWDIPPWQRTCLPLVYCNGELIAVADLILSVNAKFCLQGAKIIRVEDSLD